MENLSFDTVIIVACVCGGVVLILTIILIVLCCRRRRSKDHYEKTETSVIEPSVRPAVMSEGRNTEPRHDGSVSTRPAPDDSDSTSQLPTESGDDARGGYTTSNPTLSPNTSYPSLNRVVVDAGSSTHQISTSSAAASSSSDDKRPRKVIYEVIV